MKRLFVVTLLVVALLGLTAGLAIAVWEDTKETQVTANILPLPEGTFRFSSSSCTDAVVGWGGGCHSWLQNESPVVMTIDMITVTTSYPHVTIDLGYGVGTRVVPGQTGLILWDYLVGSEAEPGEVIFDVEVTCSGE